MDLVIFEKNSARFGGAIFITNAAGVAVTTQWVDKSQTRFTGNRANEGGAIYAIGSGEFGNTIIPEVDAGLDRLLFALRDFLECTDKYALLFPGVLEVTGVQAAPVVFSENIALENGGAVACKQSLVNAESEFQDIVFKDNSALKGGAVYLESAAQFKVQESALVMDLGEFETERNIFRGNKAQAGGAVYIK